MRTWFNVPMVLIDDSRRVVCGCYRGSSLSGASGNRVGQEPGARYIVSYSPFRCLPFVRGGEVGSSLRRLACAHASLAGPHGPPVFDLPLPLFTKEGDDEAWIASSRGCAIVLIPTENPERLFVFPRRYRICRCVHCAWSSRQPRRRVFIVPAMDVMLPVT